MIPCVDCITLSICRAKSLDYDIEHVYIEDSLYGKCFIRQGADRDGDDVVNLMVARWYLRPSLYPNSPNNCHSEKSRIIKQAKVIYKQIMKGR